MTKIIKKARDIALGQAAVVEVNGVSVLVCRATSGLRALRNACPHQALALDGARVRGDFLICPHHGARFSLVDGKSLSPLTQTPLTMLPCRATEDGIDIEV